MNPTTNTEAGAVADVAGVAASLTDAQRAIIPHMSDGELVYPLTQLVEELPDNIRLYREAVAGLRLMQLAAHGTLMNDEGQMRGSGTWLTPLGLLVKAHLSEQGATAS
jgi:hypothetical protein